MMRSERFKDLTSVNAELLRLEEVRDTHAARLDNHFQALKQSEFRSALVKNTMKDALGSFAQDNLLGSLIGGGGLGNGLSLALGAGKGGLWKRVALFALGLAAPKLLQKVESISLPDILHEFGVSWERLKDHVQQRREEKEFRNDKEENVQL
ncbi:MAG: hypothetical protein IPP95_01910 [Flavobacteriales bacterium]|nr:hypothetical protein [Flavobacteriales bacterium]MBK7247736.1 hypothetical protein [Flavobacteriales bacterium]QQS73008.1 MAG: hypothetical protein IPP95_01910 [Flavobacteriales bacterium]